MPLKWRVNRQLPKSLGTLEWRHCKGEAVGVLLTGMGRGGASSEHSPGRGELRGFRGRSFSSNIRPALSMGSVLRKRPQRDALEFSDEQWKTALPTAGVAKYKPPS
jgi:hypothetical protein